MRSCPVQTQIMLQHLVVFKSLWRRSSADNLLAWSCHFHSLFRTLMLHFSDPGLQLSAASLSLVCCMAGCLLHCRVCNEKLHPTKGIIRRIVWRSCDCNLVLNDLFSFWMRLFCLQLEASCLQWSFLLTVDNFSFFYLQLELLCLQF